tara:strand:+ start:261 stop:743 length:483 start_codon:yes stop_codon:yes gene_type:complete
MIQTEIRSRTAIKGHPLHPALIHFPVATLLLVVATDITFIITGRDFWAEASFWLIVVGLGFGILSSIPGAIDVFSVHKIRHIVAAWAHALVAVMTLSLSAFNLMLRVGTEPGAMIVPWGIYVSGLAGVFIYITGSLGAQLVFEYGVGIDVPVEDDRQVDP